MSTHLVLVGLGHAHLFVLEALARGRLPATRATLVTPEDAYYYSGMIPGVVAGFYSPDEARLSPAALAAEAGAEWVRARAAGVRAAERRIELTDGSMLAFDVASFDIGARLLGDDLPGVREYTVPVKPMREGLAIVTRAEEAVSRAGSGSPVRITICGGGAAGVEMAICLDGRLSATHRRERYRITILEAGDRILAEHPPSFGARALRLLAERGIEIATRAEVAAVGPDAITLTEGEAIESAVTLWATGARAPCLIRDSGLTTDRAGYLLVMPTLQSRGASHLFGAGDCVSIEGHPWMAKAGVYAVREGPVLAGNLARFIRGEALQRYRPQREWLSLMNTADRRALLSYRGRSYHGRAAWWLKDRIDRRFVERFQRPSG